MTNPPDERMMRADMKDHSPVENTPEQGIETGPFPPDPEQRRAELGIDIARMAVTAVEDDDEEELFGIATPEVLAHIVEFPAWTPPGGYLPQ